MLKKLYDKSKIWFAVAWIVLYCVLLSLGDSISSMIGVEKSATLPVGILLSAILLLFLKKNGLFEAYGICASKATARSMLCYLPVFIMMTANLWYGVTMNYGLPETLLYILSMFCVGFLEEVIFRGLLFNAMRQESFKWAVIVSSVTFGIGHIINLFNGSGAELIPNLLQVLYATAAGFMFVMIYCKTESLMGCIIIHGLFNALSVFANEAAATNKTRIIFALLLTVITSSYALYLAWTMKASFCNEEK
ncbi:MAG: CPBP family intramembrane metalloprotease [Clostridia bacterium]|nr:CPBP family intramembrane metalloprotease [Clostridia bacterium]